MKLSLLTMPIGADSTEVSVRFSAGSTKVGLTLIAGADLLVSGDLNVEAVEVPDGAEVVSPFSLQVEVAPRMFQLVFMPSRVVAEVCKVPSCDPEELAALVLLPLAGGSLSGIDGR